MASRGLIVVLLPLLMLLVLLLALHVLAASGYEQEAMNEEQRRRYQFEQWKRIKEAGEECQKILANLTEPTDGVYCDALFDDILCWPYTPAGTVATKSCPALIFNFNTAEFATRICQEDGSWGPPPPDANRTNTTAALAKGWTNFTACHRRPSGPPKYVPIIIKEHMPVINLISRIGYSISLVSLVVATTIMVKIKRLHCQRNVIHINLFVTFIVRAVICLLRDSLLVQGLGLPKDVRYDHNGDIEFNPHGPHWECKLLFTLFYWSLCSNYMWIFVEGLYLHTLIFFAVFDQKVIFKWYIIIGWVTPFCFLIPWVLVRIFHNDTLCWNTHEHGYYWILKGPIVISICMNFFFFLNIIRVLYTKLRASASDDSHRYRKLAKSTLVLIPLFGVYYIFFIVITNQNHRHPGLEVGLFYAEMTLNSFQGMVVAILFCFTNGEVRSEMIKRWQRHMLRRQSVASLRSSRAMSTTSFFLKERTSFSGPSRRGSKFPNVESCVSIRSMEANGDAIGRTGSKFPKPKSSPCLRAAAAETNDAGTEGGRETPVSRLSPAFPRVDDARSAPPAAENCRHSAGSLNSSNNGVLVSFNAGPAGGGFRSDNVLQGSRSPRDRKVRTTTTVRDKSPESSVTNGVGLNTRNLSCTKETAEDEDDMTAKENTPMLTDGVSCHV